jgi:predicted nucleic acid-binding protein
VESVAATYCLDACAVIAYLRQEPGAEVLKALIELPTTFLAMHVCNLGKVYYDFFREDGITAAQKAWTHTLALPLELWREAGDAFIQRVGIIKVEERVSFADAFALAERLSIPLVTIDHHEFDAVERKGHFRFLWLR